MKSSTAFHIPWPYVLWNRYFEPLSALLAILGALYDPQGFLSVFTPSISSRSRLGLDKPHLSGIETLLLTQTLSLYALFVVLEGGLLHWTFTSPMLNSVPQVRMKIFTMVMWACFASDLFYLSASWQLFQSSDAGPSAAEIFWKPWMWRRNEWMSLGGTFIPLVQRVCFLAGIGLPREKTHRT